MAGAEDFWGDIMQQIDAAGGLEFRSQLDDLVHNFSQERGYSAWVESYASGRLVLALAPADRALFNYDKEAFRGTLEQQFPGKVSTLTVATRTFAH